MSGHVPPPPPYSPSGPPPGWGPPPPSGSGGRSRVGLWIGLGVGGLVLAVGLGAGVGFAIAGAQDDDDKDPVASDDNTSAPVDPSPSSEGTDDVEPEPADPTAESEPVEPEPSEPVEPVEPTGETFTAEYGNDVGDVCDGGAMSNAAAYDPAAPRVSPFKLLPGDDLWLSVYVSSDKPYYVDYENFQEVSVVTCLTPGEPAGEVQCESTDADDKPVPYTYVTVPHSVRFVEAQTGRELGTAPDLAAPEATCPFVAFTTDGKAYSSPDDDALEAAIDGFEFA